MYAIEDVKAYLDAEKVIELSIEELRKLFPRFNSTFEPGSKKHYVEVTRKSEGFIYYDLLKGFYREPLEWRFMKLKEELGDFSQSRLLDLGCGTGLEAVFLGRYMKDGCVYATDVVQEMIQRGVERHARYPTSKVRFRQADHTRLPFEKRFFDQAIALSSLTEFYQGSHTTDANEIAKRNLPEIVKFIKPLGDLIIGGQSSSSLESLGEAALWVTKLNQLNFDMVKVHTREPALIGGIPRGEFMVHAIKKS